MPTDEDNPFAADAVPHKLTIALEMSSNITNEITEKRVVTPAGPTDNRYDGRRLHGSLRRSRNQRDGPGTRFWEQL